MANYNKSFNFRNGVQVDEDDLIVRGSLVGIGTTIPRAELDVYGTVRSTGIITAQNIYVAGIATFNDVQIGTGITIIGNSGTIAAKFFGDGAGLYNIPTSQWVDVDPAVFAPLPPPPGAGTGYTSIYAAGTVGIGTTIPRHYLQIGGDPNLNQSGVGINSTGNVNIIGILTATLLSGSGAGLTSLNASNIISGTLNNSRLPSNISISGVLTAGALFASNANISGFSTLESVSITNASIGVGTISTLNGTTATYTTGNFTNANISAGTATTLSGTTLTYTAGNLTNAYIVSGVATNLSGSNLNYSGISTLGFATVTNAYIGVATVGVASISSGRFENLNSTNLNVSGVSTVGFITATSSYLGISSSRSLQSGNIRVARPVQTNVIDTVNGNLILDSATGLTEINDNLSVSGISTLSGQVIVDTGIVPDIDTGAYLGQSGRAFSEAHIDAVRIGFGLGNDNKIDTVSGNLVLDSATNQVVIDSDLTVSGSTSFNILEIGSVARPTSDLSATLGSSSNRFSEAYIDSIRIAVGVGNSSKIDTSSGDLIFDSATNRVVIDSDLNVTGVSSFAGSVNFNTLDVGSLIRPNSNLSAALGSNANRFSEAYIDNIVIGAGNSSRIESSSGDLRLNSATNLTVIDSNLRVTGVSSFTGNVNFGALTVGSAFAPSSDLSSDLGSGSNRFAGAYLNGIRIGVGVGNSNKIETFSGNLVLDSASNLVVIDANLSVSGITTFNTLSVDSSVVPSSNLSASLGSGTNRFSEAHIDNVRIGSAGSSIIDTLTSDLVLDSASNKVIVDSNLDVSGISSFTGDVVVKSGLIPDDNFGAYLGRSNLQFAEAYINGVSIGVGNSNTIRSFGNLILDSNTNQVIIDSNLNVSNTLTISGIATFSNDSYFNDVYSNIVYISTRIVPNSDLGAALGSSSNRFSESYIDDIRIGVSGPNIIDTVTSNLILSSVTNNVNVNSNLNVSGITTFTGLVSIVDGIVPDQDAGAYLGTSALSFSEAYIDNITFGVSSNQINTRSGDLVLNANTNLVRVQNNLSVTGISSLSGLNVTGLSTFASNILPSSDKGSGLGNSNNAFSNAYINEVTIGAAATNKISTRSGNLVLSGSQASDLVVIDSPLNITGIVTFTSNLLPISDAQTSIGTFGKSFASAYIDDIQIGASGPTVIDTRNGDLRLNSSSGLVVVNQDFRVEGTANFSSGINFGSNTLFIDSVNERVGIGSTVPKEKLSVVGNSRFFDTLSIGSTTSSIILDGTNETLTVKNLIVTGSTSGVTAVGSGVLVSSFTPIQTGIVTVFNFKEGFELSAIQSGQVDVRLSNNIGIATTVTIGIGTDITDATTKLHVSGNVYVDGSLSVEDVITAPKGITSGIGTNVIIDGVGDSISLTIPGVGTAFVPVSTDLTLWDQTSSGINSLLNVGIGTTIPTSKLTVSGDARITGVVTATKFIGDGSGLIGVVGSGSGIVIYDDASLVGTASTIVFGNNLTVSPISAGVVTVTASGGGGGTSSQWVTTATGIHTTSNVGIGTTNSGSANLAIVNSFGTASFSIGQNVDGTGSNHLGIWYGYNGSSANIFTSNGNLRFDVDGAGGTTSQIEFGRGLGTETNLVINSSGDVGIGTTIPQTTLQVERYGVVTGFGTFSASAGISKDLDTFTISSTDFKTAEYTLHFINGENIQSQKVLVMQNGTTAYSQEYAIMFEPNQIVSVGATVSGGICKLQVTPESGISGLTTYRFARETML